jgi:bifunctional NMN adenylyltransferase/nudix hydrolase
MPQAQFGVYVGRFQPLHDAHLATILSALDQVDNLFIIVGSAHRTRNIKNPFTVDERIEMISACLTAEQLKRVSFVPVRDYLYTPNRWYADVQQKVSALVAAWTQESPSPRIVIIGHEKNASSEYLRCFPQWERIEVPLMPGINAADIRNLYFGTHRADIKNVPAPVAKWLDKFRKTKHYTDLSEEHAMIQAYRASWSVAPFPPMFVTVDAVVIKSGHVLVVRRKGRPGKGTIALPGGFLNANEFIADGALRELKEETGIKVPLDVLKGSIAGTQVFDDPTRSLRGRTITHAFMIDLGSGELPKVKGGDDAAKAWWMPLDEFLANEDKFFEDHFYIINHFEPAA